MPLWVCLLILEYHHVSRPSIESGGQGHPFGLYQTEYSISTNQVTFKTSGGLTRKNKNITIFILLSKSVTDE